MAVAAETGVELIEQPLPAGADAALAGPRPVPVCADESLHDRAGLDALVGRYDAVNIKLDKAGGLTEALALAAEARARGFKIMVGCMVSTSLAMAPAMLLAQGADWVDLDGPLLLARDREPRLALRGRARAPARASALGLNASTERDAWRFQQHEAGDQPDRRERRHRPIGPAGVRRIERAGEQHGAAHGDAAGDGGVERLRRPGLRFAARPGR